MSHPALSLPEPSPPTDDAIVPLDVELARAGVIDAKEPLTVRLGYGIFGAREGWLDIELDPTAATTAPVQGPLDDVSFSPGVAQAILLEDVLDRLSMVEAVGLLVRIRDWLATDGELHVVLSDALVQLDDVLAAADPTARQRALSSLFAHDRRDGWFGDKLHRVLTGLGFRMRRLRRGQDARIEVLADRSPAPPPPNAAEEVLRAFDPMSTRESYIAPRPSLDGVPTAETAPLASVLVLTFNALEDTQRCFESLEAHTHVPHELIVVDNASTDGTPEWLAAWAADRPHVRLILNEDNRGFAGGNNQALSLARGKTLVLLNNDTVVTDGWLARCIEVFEQNPHIGLVGPRSNRVSGLQLIPEVPYRNEPEDLPRMHMFARAWAEHQAGRLTPALRLVGFCLAVRREVVDRIGGLDERFGRGNFEDDDFCLRAHIAGFDACVAEDVFIHHAGGKSFRAANIDYRAALETNWTLFKTKWGIAIDRVIEEGMPVTLHPPETAMDFIPLPNIDTDHTSTAEGRVWLPTTPGAPSTATLVSMAQAASCIAANSTPQEAPVIAPPPAPTVADEPRAEVHPLTALFDQAEAAAQNGRWEEAANTFAQMIEMKPGFGPALVGFASSALAVGRVQEGIAALEEACTIYPENISLHLQLGVAVAHTGDLVRAQEAFLRVLDLDPDHIDGLVSLAHTCRVARQYVEAVELLAHAARVSPEEPNVLGAIGQTAHELGDRAGAETALAELERLAPDHDETLMLRDTLRGSSARAPASPTAGARAPSSTAPTVEVPCAISRPTSTATTSSRA